jgi:hypothetical protein
MKLVRDFQNKPEYRLIQTDIEVQEVLLYIGKYHLIEEEGIDHLLVKLDDSGADYVRIYGVSGIPYTWKSVYRLL